VAAKAAQRFFRLFAWRPRPDFNCVQAFLEQAMKRLVHQPVTFHPREVFKAPRGDVDGEMRLARRGRAGVAGMMGGFIKNFDLHGTERRLKPFANQVGFTHGIFLFWKSFPIIE
jgi:hypothetical protein